MVMNSNIFSMQNISGLYKNITNCNNIENLINYTINTELTAEAPGDPGFILRYGLTATILLSLAYGVIFIIGVCGNIAVVIVVVKCSRMRSPTNQFIANLAIADLLVNILCLPFTLVGNLFPAWILGVFFCKTVSYFQGVSVSASINTLMAISIERCAAISFPLSGTMSSKHYKLVVSIIWIVALTINLPWLFVFTLEPIGISGSMAEVCIELWSSQQTENLYFVLANLIVCYLGPLFVITICYLIIWRKVANRNVPGEHAPNRRNEIINRSKVKVIKMVFVVIITFAVSWLPLYIIFIFVKFYDNLLNNDTVQVIIFIALPIAQWLGAANSCINPILYAFMNRKFRIGFKALLKKPWCSSGLALDQDINDINLKRYRSDCFYLRRTNNVVRTNSLRSTSTNQHNNCNFLGKQFRQNHKNLLKMHNKT